MNVHLLVTNKLLRRTLPKSLNDLVTNTHAFVECGLASDEAEKAPNVLTMVIMRGDTFILAQYG